MKNIMLLSVSLLIMLLTSTVANAQLAFPIVQRVSVSHGIQDGSSNTIVTLAQSRDGSSAVIARTFDGATGFQRGEALLLIGLGDGSARPVDVILSTVFQPGSVLVLDTARRVHVFPVMVLADGSVRLAAPETVLGPIGPTNSGAGNVLGEVPNPSTPSDPFLAIGTTSGKVLITSNSGMVLPAAQLAVSSTRAVTDLGAFTENGYFALGAISGGQLFVINPDDDSRLPGLQPVLKAQLRDPRRTWLDLGTPELRRDSLPLSRPATIPIVIADGTTEIATYEIPVNLSLGPVELSASLTQISATPVKQVIPGSLTWLPVDGGGILYNRAFTFADGLLGRIWTIAGASLEFAHQTLNLRSRDRFITAAIECENQRAAEIMVSTLKFSVEANGFVRPERHPAPELEDVDGDTNLDLQVTLDREELIDLLRHCHAQTALVHATWRYTDGSRGSATAQLRLR